MTYHSNETTTEKTSTSTPITVSALTLNLKKELETQFSTLCVKGEVSNAKKHSSGHIYFDLKDRDAKISCVLFKNARAPLSHPLNEGDEIIIYGALTLYPPHGKYQILVKRVEHAGRGALLLELERRKQALKEKGWFDLSRKKNLPPFPKRIGVVTSPTGAVIRDIVHVLKRRLKGFHLLLAPVRVQGQSAAIEIAEAITDMSANQRVDVLIIGRGGGSLEDLWAFNELPVLKAIYTSQIPIISAVGHETDVTLSDFVADVRAPTPSAAAEIVSKESAYFLEKIKKAKELLPLLVRKQLKEKKFSLRTLSRHPVITNPQALLAMPLQRIDESRLILSHQINRILLQKKFELSEKQKKLSQLDPKIQWNLSKQRHLHLKKILEEQILLQLSLKQKALQTAAHRLIALSPKNVLKRGYSILFSQKKLSVILSPQQIESGDTLRVILAEGETELNVP